MVTFDIQDGAAILTLDDGKANALSLGMSQALDAALDRAAAEARVVVVRGLAMPDEDVHAPNEFFRLASFDEGLRTWPMLLSELGKLSPADFGRRA